MRASHNITRYGTHHQQISNPLIDEIFVQPPALEGAAENANHEQTTQITLSPVDQAWAIAEAQVGSAGALTSSSSSVDIIS